MWDYILPGASSTVDEQGLALTAAYLALNRYINGNDIYIVPTTKDELEQALYVSPNSLTPRTFQLIEKFISRRYSADAIHNYVAKSRSPLHPGGYTRVRTPSLIAPSAVVD